MMTVDLSGNDRVRKFLRIIKGSAESRIVRTAIGEKGASVIRENFFEKDKKPNRLGGARTHFWRQAGDSVGYDLHPDGAVAFATKLGIMQRLHGGVITPKNTDWLTIPIEPEAHGKRARELNLDLKGRFLVDSTEKALFVLKRRVVQKEDPSVLPSQKKLNEEIVGVTLKTVELLLQRN